LRIEQEEVNVVLIILIPISRHKFPVLPHQKSVQLKNILGQSFR